MTRQYCKMRDKRFVAEHRGGPLKRAHHYQLMTWAGSCVEHAFSLAGERMDDRLSDVLRVAEAWQKGEASVGDARNASLRAIAVANESSDPVTIALARAAGHVAAIAHMADHSLRAADYAMKAIKESGRLSERQWQEEQLPVDIRSLVLSAQNR